jgi:hypothetical protein
VILSAAMSIDDSLPNDVATLQSMLVAERAARLAAQAEMRCQHFLLTRSSRDFGLAGPLLHSLASKGSSHLSQGCDKITCHIYCGDP